MKKRKQLILTLLTVSSLALTVYAAARYLAYREKTVNDAEKRLVRLSRDAALDRTPL